MSSFSLTCADALLRERTTPDDWRRIVGLRDHPRFLFALFKYCELIPDYFAGALYLNKVVTESARFEMLAYALYLYDTRNPGDPRTGLTVARLSRICAERNVASRGRVIAILGIMQIVGYLRQRRSEIDKRIVHLEPTAKFIAIVEAWNVRILQVLDVVDNGEAFVNAYRADARFGWDMRRRGAEALLAGWNPLDPFPELRLFYYRDGGWMLLLACAANALQQSNGREIAPVSLDLGAFGKRFGVSRSHLRRLLEDAFALGFLKAPPKNGQTILFAPDYMAMFLTWMASELSNYRLWAIDLMTAVRMDVSHNDVGNNLQV